MRRFLRRIGGLRRASSAARTIASAVVLAHIVAGVITDPARAGARTGLAQLWILLALWMFRTLAHWQQGRLAQRGATR